MDIENLARSVMSKMAQDGEDYHQPVRRYGRKTRYTDRYLSLLENALAVEDIYERLYNQIEHPHRWTMILRGHWGLQFMRWIRRNNRRYAGMILFPGGMKDGKARSPVLTDLIDPDEWARKACTVHASYHLGCGRAGCLQLLSVQPTIPTYVAYCAAPIAPPYVTALHNVRKEG